MAPSRNQFQVDNSHFVDIAYQKRVVTNIIQDNVGTLLITYQSTPVMTATALLRMVL